MIKYAIVTLNERDNRILAPFRVHLPDGTSFATSDADQADYFVHKYNFENRVGVNEYYRLDMTEYLYNEGIKIPANFKMVADNPDFKKYTG